MTDQTPPSDQPEDISSQLSSSEAPEAADQNDGPSRRQFIAGAAAGAAFGLGTAVSANAAEQENLQQEIESPFQPESYWKDRMKDPEDGKKFGWLIDTRRCFGCHGCEVSCKSENDVPLGNFIRQTFYHDVGQYPQVARMFMPMSCQHCEDAPCIKACPCGALHKNVGGTVAIDYETCCGHGSCVDVCPYGAIYMDPVANQAVKCHNCYHRVENDMEPACANTCPSDAIYFGDLNDSESKVSKALAALEKEGQKTSQLRAEAGTKPRVWFTGPAPEKVEPKIPRQGESYSGEAYDIYNWKESSDE